MKINKKYGCSNVFLSEAEIQGPFIQLKPISEIYRLVSISPAALNTV
jgi:hypothetical protein